MKAGKKNAGTGPARWTGIPAALCALLLTGCLFAALACLLGLQALGSSRLHTRAALAADVVDAQMTRIREETKKLAETYGFDAEIPDRLITREAVEEYDREVVTWWTGAFSDGKLKETPSFRPEGLDEALEADEAFMGSLDPLKAGNILREIRGRIQETVRKSAVLFRDLLAETAFRFAGKRLDLPEMADALQRLPLLAGAAAFLAAGLIAALRSRRIRTAWLYIGGAAGACGLLGVFTLVLLRRLRLGEMIAESSRALSLQFAHLSRMLTAEILIGAAVLLILGGLLMHLGRKGT